jgi:hypothetical protein
MKQIWIMVASLLLLTLGVVTYVQRQINPPVENIVASSLKAVQEQNRLTSFAARFVTVVTSRKSQFGLSAEKTLIVPAMVRYEVDLGKLTREDVRWDAASETLSVRLPAVSLGGPEFDLPQTREYQSGLVLMTLTDVERLLDRENRTKAAADVLAQARAEPMMKLARAATIRAVASSFAMPLRAAGVEVKVVVGFGT